MHAYIYRPVSLHKTLLTLINKTMHYAIIYIVAQETIRLEVLHLSQIPFYAYKVTTMKDDMFTIGSGERIIVYNRNDLTKVKYVIALPGTSPLDIAACNVSNCVYVLVDTKPTKEAYHYSILRITENKAHRFNSLPWIRALHLQDFACISVSDNGSLIVRSWPFMVCTYDAKGRLKSKVKSSPSSPRISCWYNPIYKSNGNFVLACYSDEELTEFDDTESKEFDDTESKEFDDTESKEFDDTESKEFDDTESKAFYDTDSAEFYDTESTEFQEQDLTEFDATGSFERKYKSSISLNNSFFLGGMQMADVAGRFVITEADRRINIFDSEFNRLEFTGPHLSGGNLHYSSERNEVVSVWSVGNNNSVLTIFRFTDE